MEIVIIAFILDIIRKEIEKEKRKKFIGYIRLLK